MTTPAWLLLIWSGLGAACAAAAIGASIGGVASGSWSLAPLPRSRTHGAAWSLLAGMFIYPIVYGLAFELFQRADVRAGFILGLLHAVAVFSFIRPRAPLHPAVRAAAAHLAYGTVLGFLYVTP
ncbi:MAG TPA: hypothetical protein VFZ24_11725 [Longimicrobiales bacterium]